MALLARHRIMASSRCGYVRAVGADIVLLGVNIHLRVAWHHALIHTIEGKVLAVRSPERPLVNTELIAVHTLTVYDVLAAIGAAIRADLELLALGRKHIQVALESVGYLLALAVEIYVCSPLRQGHVEQSLPRGKIYQQMTRALGKIYHSLTGIGE